MEILNLILQALDLGEGHPFKSRFVEIIESYKEHGTLTESEVMEIEKNISCGILISSALRKMTS